VAPADAKGSGLSVSEPAEALLRVCADAGDAAVVVLADLDVSGLQELARAVPGLAVIVGGSVDGPSQEPIAIGAARIVHVANLGKTLGWWAWGAANCHFDLIEDSIPDLPEVRTVIRSYQDDLANHDFAVDDAQGLASLGEKSAATFVGDAACMTCHATAHETHSASRHAHSMQSLERKGYVNDPDCLKCHVTGLGRRDGFQRQAGMNSAFARVGCESCHGPGSGHVTERQAGRAASGSLLAVTPATCIRCHDGENSPAFTYDSYWPRIAHGLR
jgi:hypothetical protein